MTRRSLAVTPATAISVVLATMALAACGPGDNASSSAPQQSAPNLTANAADTAAYANAGNAGNATNAASDTLAAAPAVYASDPVQSVQASLAADSEQIAPVMSYAPGDEPPQTNSAINADANSSTGNESRSTVTTSQ
ncbi:MAG: hypothetical protein V4793_09590 [Paraburkholderia tropica]|uniref:Lipoprotein n=1 Tax=Paraburkholderia tropica TaxID=92647 RepID=A0ABX5MUF8_9BURK|nr:hypothetical protein [Paraburkholderia tropica]MDE1138853.1 hypothetical protein [Paraburkholderia tropica]PXX18779.1 hypothetical protein C7400_104289 [Paraburkholderia tropica]PZW87311.1 hypothetical protein C7399_104288 [Paraburkholderia tropica]